jgi:hypothetical protein
MASPQKILMQGVRQAVVTALAASSYADDNVRLRRIPSLNQFADGKKCCISPAIERLSDSGTNERDAVGYGVMVAMAFGGNNDFEYTDTFDALIVDRQILRKYLHNKTQNLLAAMTTAGVSLPAGYLINSVKVELGPFMVGNFQQNNIDATVLVVRINVRETRP